MDTAISKAHERLNFVTQDKNFLREYHRRQMELSDWTTGINTAMEKGIQQGMDKGMETKSFDIARKALAENLPVGLIQKITGLRLEYIIALQARK